MPCTFTLKEQEATVSNIFFLITKKDVELIRRVLVKYIRSKLY